MVDESEFDEEVNQLHKRVQEEAAKREKLELQVRLLEQRLILLGACRICSGKTVPPVSALEQEFHAKGHRWD